jgi:hypothetical protein
VIRAEKPAAGGPEARAIEAIPTPAAQEPLPGPAVEPAPPAAGAPEVPAAKTSGRLLKIVPPAAGHTT